MLHIPCYIQLFSYLCSDNSDEEPPNTSRTHSQPTIELLESTVSVNSSSQSVAVARTSVNDINVPEEQKHNLVVPNHQQSVMSNFSSLWKAKILCDAYISNGTVDIRVNGFFIE